MVVYDKLGRTWKGRKIVWIRSINCARLALYRLTKHNGKKKLVYDKKRGMYDENGNYVKESKVEIIPALEGMNDDGIAVPNTWEHFPDTYEAQQFIKTINHINNIPENDIEIYEEDSDIIIK